MSRRQLLFSMSLGIPIVVSMNLTGANDLPFGQSLLAAVGLGVGWGAVIGLTVFVARRVRHGAWSRKPLGGRSTIL